VGKPTNERESSKAAPRSATPLLFRPFWPDTRDYEALNWTLFLGASVIAGFVVGKWALALPWVLVIAAVTGLAVHIAILNASVEGQAGGDGPLSALILVIPYGIIALIAAGPIALGSWLRKRLGASSFARA